MDLREEIKKEIEKVVVEMGISADKLSVSFSNLPEICDFQTNFALLESRNLGKKPFELASEIVDKLKNEKVENLEFSVAMPGFINIKVTEKLLSDFANEVIGDERLGVAKVEKPRKILIDYGGANVAKELHVGHLRSPIIGEALKRLHRFLGDYVVADTHLGDWGLQMGLTILQLKNDGFLDEFFEKNAKISEISLKNVTLDTLNEEYPKASKRKDIDEEFKKLADTYTLYIQQKKEPYFTIYKQIRELSVEEIKKNYSMLNAYFDYWYGESDADKYIDEVLEIFEKKGLVRESDGAMVVDIAEEGEHIPIPKKSPDEVQRYKNPMPPAILKKYNGGVLYLTTEIATILMRNRMDNFDEMIYLTDNRQGNHFIQAFRCAKKAGISPAEQVLKHIAFGTMNGKDGKPFKTRSGETIKLKDVINLLIDKASEKLKANGIENDRELARKIGVAAMKFGDLSNIISKDYVFDIDKFLSFDGKTGPYIQYTIARINSILEKKDVDYGEIKIETKEERDILMMLLKLNSAYFVGYADYSLNLICSSTFDLAKAFSTLYNNTKILSEKNLEKKRSLLSLCLLVKKALSNALEVLGIDVVEKMWQALPDFKCLDLFLTYIDEDFYYMFYL